MSSDFMFSMQGYTQLKLLEEQEIGISHVANRIFAELGRNDMPSNVVLGALKDDPKYNLHFLADEPQTYKLAPSKMAERIASDIGLKFENLEDIFDENLKKNNVLLGIHKTESGNGTEKYNRCAYIPYDKVVIYAVKWNKNETAICVIPTKRLNEELAGIEIKDYILSVKQEALTKPLVVCMENMTKAFYNKVDEDKFYDAL